MRGKKAFTLVEILIVVAIIGILATVGVPAVLNSLQNSRTRIKEVNVESVEAAKEQWALVNNASVNTVVTWTNIAPYMGSGVSSQNDLRVNGEPIVINNIGTPASY